MLKVLAVEDDPSVASLVREILDAEGYATAVVQDIAGAWESLLAAPPDVAVVDLGLPGGQVGWDLVEEIRRDERYRWLPIVILTAKPPEDVLERADALDCAYLSKPFSAPALLDRIQLAMRTKGRAPELRTVRVDLLMRRYRVQGSIHVPAELPRFSDAWEAVMRDPRIFLPITQAAVTTVDESQQLARADVLTIRKDEVSAARPLD
jgi:DNA-binding response OmpR family regulator